MPWTITTGRPSGRFEPLDDDGDDYVLNGFACVAEVRAFTICRPACGALGSPLALLRSVVIEREVRAERGDALALGQRPTAPLRRFSLSVAAPNRPSRRTDSSSQRSSSLPTSPSASMTDAF
jgi:hypothetical protein